MIFANDHDKTMEKRNDAKIIAQNEAKILELENKISRLESELEARLALQEDIHMDEVLGLEKKYNDQLELARKIVEADAQRDANSTITSARYEADRIKKEAYDEARKYVEDIITLFIQQIAENKIPFGDIESLIKSATENYPTLSDVSLSSTSSSK